MPFTDLEIAPGIDIEKTMLLNQAGWSSSTGIRFFDGLLQKRGGFLQITPTPVVGTGRGMHAWADLVGNDYLVVGSDQRLMLYTGSLNDITPIRVTHSAFVLGANVSVTLNSSVVTVTDAGHGLSPADWIQVVIPISVGAAGVALLIPAGFYQVQTVPNANTYTFNAPSLAPSTSTAAAVPSFTTVNTQTNVTVNLNNHGQSAGQTFQVQVTTVVGGITITAGFYTVASVTNVNAFVIVPGAAATSSTTVSENSGNAYLNYLIPTGAVNAGTATSNAYGMGNYGVGAYGHAGSSVIPLRQWFLDHFGQYMIGNYTGSPIYVYRPGTDTVAIPVDATHFPSGAQMPTQVNASFMATPQQMLVGLGCDTPGSGVFNPLLVRWCDAGDFTNWQATSTDLAGSYSIPSGSRLVGGISSANFSAVFTDVDMWTMNYLGGAGGLTAQYVWGFNRVVGSRGLLAARAIGLLATSIYYPSPNGFFSYNGGRSVFIPCPVWDFFWQNVNLGQIDKVHCAVNSQFQEITWYFPSLNSMECDSAVTLCLGEGGVWYYEPSTTWTRTCWIDQNVLGAPIGVDLNSLLQQAEQGNDANGQPLSVSAQTGWFAVSAGSLIMMLERITADLKVTGGNQQVYITVYAQDYPNDPQMRTYGPFAWMPGQTSSLFSIVRARGRFMSIKISSNDAGVFWRLGRMRYLVKRAGSRP